MSKVAVVTGASQGIGAACAVAFAQAGYQVVATSRSVPEIPEVNEPGVESAALDITEEASVDQFVSAVLERHGKVDVLVNNAGIGSTGSTEELSIDDLRRSMEVNFFGTFRLTKAFLEPMRLAGGGRIIAVGSIAGTVGQPFNDAYCAGKHAIEGLYEALSPVAATSGVVVSIVEPGPVRSDHRNRAIVVPPLPHLAPMRDRYLAMTDDTFENAQLPERVAQIVLQAAEDPTPKLRYQTSRLVTRIVGMKLADLDGSAITGMTAAWIA